jgi:hypothetical protein
MTFSPAPNNIYRGVSTMVTPFSREGFSRDVATMGAPSSAAYPAGNRAYYYSIFIPAACTIYKLFWLNGATASTNNVQMGLYYDDGTNKPGAAVVRGTSTLAAGANICQYDNITDTTIGAGRYWIAIWCSGTTTTQFRRLISGGYPSYAYLESSIAGGLPTTATPATATSNPPVIICGLVTRSTP